MAIIKEGAFTLNLGIVQLGGKLTDDDRQCAWEFYTEIATRVAVVGKRPDKACKDFAGELYSESLDSLYKFFQESRLIMRRFPVGRIKDFRQEHLGTLINRILANVLRPFLEKWNGQYRGWWAQEYKPGDSPYAIQKTFPRHREFLADWTALRLIMRRVETTLTREYKLVPLE
jgi:hypothetical protein